MKCPHCGYEWPNRTSNPKECPRCKGRLDYKSHPRVAVGSAEPLKIHKLGGWPKHIARKFALTESSKASVRQVLVYSLVVLLMAPALVLLLTTQGEIVEASPDDNFGYDTIGGSSVAYEYSMVGSVFTCPSDETAASIVVYTYDEWGGEAFQCAIYDTDGRLLQNGTTEIRTDLGESADWYSFNFSTPPSLNADENYILACRTEEVTHFWYDNGDGETQGYYQNGALSSFPQDANFTSQDRKYSIYCVFYVPPIPPEKPILVFPENDTTVSHYIPYFEWQNGEGADNHRIEVDNDSDFSSVIDNETITEGNTWIKTGGGYPVGTYYWRVVAVNQFGENQSENEWTFTIDENNIYVSIVYAGDVGENWVHHVRMPQDNMKIKVHITHNVTIENVILEWYDNDSWENYGMTDNGGGNYTITMPLENGRDYGFDVWAVGGGIENELQWLRTDNNNTLVRRYIGGNYSIESLDYAPFYITNATYAIDARGNRVLEHEQLSDGSVHDTNYLQKDYPPDETYGYCLKFILVVINENLTIPSETSIENVYYYFWWNEADIFGSETHLLYVRWLKNFSYGTYEESREVLDNENIPMSEIRKTYPITGYQYDEYYLYSGFLDISDNLYDSLDIYGLGFEFTHSGTSANIEWVSMEGLASYFIFNLPDNSTLAGMDSDGDGWDDNYELYTSYTNPFLADTDADGIQDNIDADPLIPTAPTLHLPENDSETGNQTYFEWKMAVNADNHRLLVDNDEGFPSPNENRFFTADNYYTIPFENALLRDNYWWKVIASYAGTERASDAWTFEVRWFLMESWSGAIKVPRMWNLIETWTGTVEAYVAWQLMEEWGGNIEAYVEWQLVETWTGSIKTQASWQTIETLSGSVEAYVSWNLIETWTGTVEALAEWELIKTWIGTIATEAEWQSVESWTGIIGNPEAVEQWNLVETWIGGIKTAILAQVTTHAATGVGETSATLNASITYGDFPSVDIRFQHRQSGAGVWEDTSWTYGHTSTSYSDGISGLSSSTTYEFRGHIQFNSLEDFGDVLEFTTETPPPPNTPPTKPTIVLTPETIYVETELWITANSTDAESDPITYYFKFYNVSDTTIRQDWSIDNSYVIAQADAHDTIRCFAKAHDGTEYSDENSADKSVSNTPPTTSNPKCEGQTNPSAVDDRTPDFAWTYSDAVDSDVQSHWQIYVGTSEGSSNKWDSGELSGSDTADVYAGSSLENSTNYWWQVRTKDGYDLSSWATGTFTTYFSEPPSNGNGNGSSNGGTQQRLTVLILDNETDDPIEGVSVELHLWGSLVENGVTRWDGSCVLDLDVQGIYDLRWTKSGYLDEVLEIELNASAYLTLKMVPNEDGQQFPPITWILAALVVGCVFAVLVYYGSKKRAKAASLGTAFILPVVLLAILWLAGVLT